MTPAEIKQWQAEHGGAAGAPETDEHGITTYRAADGNYIVVRSNGTLAMRGYAPAGGAPQQAAPGASAPAPAGGPMTQEQLDALLSSVGGGSLVHAPAVSRVTIKNPNALANGGNDQNAPAETTYTVQQWTNPGTGYVVKAYQKDDGTWEIQENNPRGVSVPASVTRTPEQQRSDAAQAATNEAQAASEKELNRERQWNSEHGYGWVTHAQREAAARQEETQARADKNQERLVAAQEAQNQLARDRLQFDKDKANLPDVKATETKINGQTYTRVTTTTPQGVVTIKNYGPDGKEVTTLPVEGAGPGQAEPPGAPPLELTYGNVSRGLEERSKWLNEQVQRYQATGGKEGMSPEAATKSMERAVKLAEAALKEQGGIIDTQAGIYGHEVTQRGQTLNDTESRRSSAQAIYNNTLNQFISSAPHAGRGGGKLAGPAFQEALAMGRNYVNSFGGFRDTPPVETGGFPALNDMRTRSLAPSQAPAPAPVQPRPVTAPAAMAPPTLGSPEGQGLLATNEANRQLSMAPGPPAGPSPEPMTPAAVNPVNDQPITGPFSPPERDDWRLGGPSFVQQSRNGTAGRVSPYVQGLINDPQVDNSILDEAWQAEYGTPLPMSA